MAKLTKQQIAEGIKQIPIERIILGAQGNIKLTPKQKRFAEQVVATGNKTEAYRRAYDHKGSNRTAGRDSQKIANKPSVATYITALEAAKSAEEYLLPARIRTMAIHKLTSMALNDGIAPAQQLKALELVGKMTEVALFSERREVVHTLDASSMRDKLLQSLKLAIQTSASIDTRRKHSAQELLERITGKSEPVQDLEILKPSTSMDASHAIDPAGLEPLAASIPGATPVQNPDLSPPTVPQPPFFQNATIGHLHSIPHKELPLESIPEHKESPPVAENLTVARATVTEIPKQNQQLNFEGGGVVSFVEGSVPVGGMTPPPSNWVENG